MVQHQPDPISHHEQYALQFERIVFFSDAVFAIAITLLVIEIKVPVFSGAEEGMFGVDKTFEIYTEGPDKLLHLLPKIIGFIVSFLIVGRFWINHHRNFGIIRRYDDGLLWRNIILLMGVAFIPFTTALFSEYVIWDKAAVFYCASLMVVGLMQLDLWRYATKNHRLIDASVSRHLIDKIMLTSMAAPLAFGLAMIGAFIGQFWLPGVTWIIIPLMIRYANRRYEQRVAAEEKTLAETA